MSPAPRIPVEERLFSLVLALLATDAGLTKNEILSTVQGYRQKYSHSGDNANLERQFERDKDDIRDLGVPLETIESPGQAGNNQNLRYRIPRGTYELPVRRAVLLGRDHAAEPRGDGLAGGLALGRVAARAAQAPVARGHRPPSPCSATPRGSECGMPRSSP